MSRAPLRRPTRKADKATARARAREILASHGIADAPVPVERIARRMGVQVRFASFGDELSGMAHVQDGVRIIGVNALHHPNRQRFTIAHELAHHVLHAASLQGTVHVDRIIMHRNERTSRGVDPDEIEANAFASELLMPTDILEAAVAGGVDLADERALERLAARFKVSVTALQFRLGQED